MKGQGKIMAPLSPNVNVLSATFRNPPACWYHANVTLGGGKRKVAESTLRKAESGAVNLPKQKVEPLIYPDPEMKKDKKFQEYRVGIRMEFGGEEIEKFCCRSL